jgi:hypothetical protein
MDEMHDLAIPKKSHRRAAWLIFTEILSGPGYRLEVLPGKNSHYLLRDHRVLKGKCKGRPSISGSAPADGIYKDEHGPFLVAQCRIYVRSTGELFRAESRDFCTHGGDESGIIGHRSASLTIRII